MKKMLLAFLGAVSTFILVNCAPIRILNLNLQPNQYDVIRDVRFMDHARGTLDVYTPKNIIPDKPLIIWIYGGSWEEGDKKNYAFIGDWLARQGYRVIVPNYRLYPEVKFPDFLYDNAQSVAAALKLTGQTKFVLMGHSAGAYNAAMLANNPKYLKSVGINLSQVAGFVGLAGPYDFHPYDVESTKNTFGHEQNPKITMPIYYASAASPKTLLLHGLKDDLVLPRNSEALDRALRAKNVPVTLIEYPDKTHVSILSGLSNIGVSEEIRGDIGAFLAGIN